VRRDGTDVRTRLRGAFAWLGDRTDEHRYADVTAWWRDSALLRDVGAALADLFRVDQPTVVMGIEARGFILGPLVAVSLDAGFVEVRKDPSAASDSDRWIRQATPPDYRDRVLTLGVRRDLIGSADRVLLVDDWIDTGGQALGAQRIADEVEATWVGTAVIVDALESHEVRRELKVKSLMHHRELW
jgi:adenine phosphoribosyltransferase